MPSSIPNAIGRL